MLSNGTFIHYLYPFCWASLLGSSRFNCTSFSSLGLRTKHLQNLLHSSALPEYKAATLKKPRFILSHYGAFKTFWDWLILIATFYVAIVVPYSASFRDTMNREHIRTIYTDVFVEVVFIIGKCPHHHNSNLKHRSMARLGYRCKISRDLHTHFFDQPESWADLFFMLFSNQRWENERNLISQVSFSSFIFFSFVSIFHQIYYSLLELLLLTKKAKWLQNQDPSWWTIWKDGSCVTF